MRVLEHMKMKWLELAESSPYFVAQFWTVIIRRLNFWTLLLL